MIELVPLPGLPARKAAGERVAAVAGVAAEALEELPAPLGRRGGGAAREPLLERGRLHGDDGADHLRVERAAVLGAEQVIGARHRRLEPRLGVAARHRVLLHAELGHEEAVDDVLRGEEDLDGSRDRHVQLVDLALAAQVLELPHPLLADTIDLEGVGGRGVGPEVDVRPPDVREEEDDQRHYRPRDLEPIRAVHLRGPFVAGAAAVADREVEDEPGDEHRHEAAHREQVVEEMIGTRRQRRRLLREDGKGQEAAHVGFPSCRRSTTTSTPSATAVSAADTRTTRAIMGV